MKVHTPHMKVLLLLCIGLFYSLFAQSPGSDSLVPDTLTLDTISETIEEPQDTANDETVDSIAIEEPLLHEDTSEIPKSSYMATRWRPMVPFYQEEHNRKEKFLEMVDWKHGGYARFGGDFTYNFRIDTATQYNYNFGNPSQTDIPFDLHYTHRFNKIVWAGGGVTRSRVNSHYFDSLYIDRKGWWGRMGVNFHVAVPGFKYELTRDPRLIPLYGRYDRKALQNLVPNGASEFTHLNVYEESSLIGKNEQGDSTNRGITIPKGIGHNFTFKLSKVSYSLIIDTKRYSGLIQHIKVADLPFFKGQWGFDLIILPTHRVVPSLNIGFYTIKIPLGSTGLYQLNVTPVTAQLEMWSSNEFSFSAYLSTEFLHLKKRQDY